MVSHQPLSLITRKKSFNCPIFNSFCSEESLKIGGFHVNICRSTDKECASSEAFLYKEIKEIKAPLHIGD